MLEIFNVDGQLKCEFCNNPADYCQEDPFAYEIMGDDTICLMCGSCYSIHSDDI